MVLGSTWRWSGRRWIREGGMTGVGTAAGKKGSGTVRDVEKDVVDKRPDGDVVLCAEEAEAIERDFVEGRPGNNNAKNG